MEGRQLTLGESIQEYVDSHSNRWWIDPSTNRVLLKLASEEKPRNTGTLVNNRFVIRRSREKHLYRMTESYGFNSEIIKNLGVEYVDLNEDEGMFRIPVNLILEHGEYIFYKKQGFEKQLFLPIRLIFPFKVVPELDEKRISLMGESWYKRLKPEFEKDYMIKLAQYVSGRRMYGEVFPAKEDVFRAFKLCSFEGMKVLVLGQDPYHTANVADGLAFSSGLATYLPPSLKIIYQGMEKEMHLGLMLQQNPSLEYLAKQGILLLNTILTVEKGKPLSHAGIGWEEFTKAALLEVKNSTKSIVVFLWGRKAQEYRQYIDNGKHLILEAEHPAFAARENRDWENHQCFTKANKFLTSNGYGAIEW